jgi:hypothetical protein
MPVTVSLQIAWCCPVVPQCMHQGYPEFIGVTLTKKTMRNLDFMALFNIYKLLAARSSEFPANRKNQHRFLSYVGSSFGDSVITVDRP